MTAQPRANFDNLLRGTVGFDRLADILGQSFAAGEQVSGYPPYNIEKTGEDSYRVTLAVAGFARDEIEIEQRDNQLVILGRKSDDTGDRTYLHRGIAARDFRRQFQLADHVKVEGATLENGLLHVSLFREVPEERRPRKIEIGAAS